MKHEIGGGMSIAYVLKPAHKRHLARLAREAGCQPQDLLNDVFKYGFDYVQQDVRETGKGIAEIEAGKGISHGQVMVEARAVIERYVRKQKAAA
ncbi:MAG: hypothetical protein ACKVQK_31355 [Burkholderiales bacterium]